MIIKPDSCTKTTMNAMQTTRVDGLSTKPYGTLDLGLYILRIPKTMDSR